MLFYMSLHCSERMMLQTAAAFCSDSFLVNELVSVSYSARRLLSLLNRTAMEFMWHCLRCVAASLRWMVNCSRVRTASLSRRTNLGFDFCTSCVILVVDFFAVAHPQVFVYETCI